MPNRLAEENSLYLQQHAENPVDWRPWGEDAIRAAQEAGKPLLISIGYSSCHWCHVMAHESFEDEYIAGLMNTHFINVKVDREEHPEVDQFYMEAVQMITRHGGWPLNVFCLPDGRPFFGGTYFPPKDAGNGLIPWPQLLVRIGNFYNEKRGELEENADAILKNMAHADASIAGGGDTEDTWNPEFLVSAATAICRQHDDTDGGFGDAPKFPQAMTLDFLLQFRNTARAEAEPAIIERLDTVLLKSLRAMAFGGIYDQIGGGFSRYSVDRHWLIPHFEKMLYDNGLLLELYSKAWRRYRDPLFLDIAGEIVRWMDREMADDNTPLFYASLDADSEGEEGKFYVWTPEQIHEALPEQSEAADAFISAYGISNEGNFENDTSQPALLSGDREARHNLADIRDRLYDVRARRVWPQRDSKQLLSWNALAIRGRIEYAFARGSVETLAEEGNRLKWIWEHMQDPDGNFCAIHYPGSGASVAATLLDYAFLLETVLTYTAVADVVEPGTYQQWLERCRQLADTIETRFGDANLPGYFFAPEDQSGLVVRRKEWVDNAQPSGNSSLLHSFASLYALTGETRYQDAFLQLRHVAKNVASRMPTGVGHALSALSQEATGILLIKVRDAQSLEKILPTLRERPWRRLFFCIPPGGDAQGVYQLCAGTTCLPPESDPEAIAEQVGPRVISEENSS